MNCEFMIASTPLPPCMPLPKVMLRLPVSNTAKVMYARLLDEILTSGNPGLQRDFVYPLPHHGDSGGTLPKPPDLQAFPKRAGTGRDDNACPSGNRGGQPHLYSAPQGGRCP